jgi:Uma2 family endonuclease
MLLETKTLTYEEYLAMPETNCRYEIIDGVLLMSPTPVWKHNRYVRRIANLLEAFVMEKDLGEVQQAPYDVVVEEEPLRTRQPDVLFVSADKVKALGIETLDELAQLSFAPNLDEKETMKW